VFSVIRINPNIFAYAFDCSQQAISVAKNRTDYDPQRCEFFVHDIEKDSLPSNVPQVDVISLIFSLSAMTPSNFPLVLERLKQVLKSGGVVLLRDYGLYDLAQLRYGEGQKLAENYYVRGDGTRAFYFSKEYTIQLFQDVGFVVDLCDYCTVRTRNRLKKINLDRVWISGRFCKP